MRQTKYLAIIMASSGMAATNLLSGGCTIHSYFKHHLGLSKNDKANRNNRRSSVKCKYLGECKLIIQDETTMNNKVYFEAVDMVLQDLSVMRGVNSLEDNIFDY